MADASRGHVVARFLVDGNDTSSGDLGVFSEVRVRLPDNGPARFEASFLATHPNWEIVSALGAGQTVEIQVGYKNDPPGIFKGEVTALRYRGQRTTTASLVLEGADRLHRLSRGVHQRLHVDVTDKDLVEKCLGEAALTPKQVEDPGIIYPSIAQYNQDNLAFLMDRARRLGFCLWADGDDTYFGPRGEGEGSIKLKIGSDINNIRVRSTVAHLASSVEIRGWDMAKKEEQVVRANAGEETVMDGSGDAGPETAQSFTDGIHRFGTLLPRSQKEAELIAKGQLTRRSFAFAVGELSCIGDPRIKPGSQIEVIGMGAVERGIYHVGEVNHRWVRQAGSGEESFTTQLKLRRNFVNTV